jgi:hypothetical protein
MLGVSPNSSGVASSSQVDTLAEAVGRIGLQAEEGNSEELTVSQFIKKIFTFSGSLDELGMSAPLHMSQPVSGLEIQTQKNFGNFVKVIESENASEIDRFLTIVAFFLSNMSFLKNNTKKPLNPIIQVCIIFNFF